jgi:hypothetical protein
MIFCEFKKMGSGVWVEFSWLRIGSSGGSYDHGNELSGFIKGSKFLYQLLKDYGTLNWLKK